MDNYSYPIGADTKLAPWNQVNTHKEIKVSFDVLRFYDVGFNTLKMSLFTPNKIHPEMDMTYKSVVRDAVIFLLSDEVDSKAKLDSYTLDFEDKVITITYESK